MRTKVIQGKNYGSIPHLSTSKLGKHDRFIHEGQERIIRNGGRDKHDVVIVSLKLDGTNVGVIKRDGQLITLQRKGYACASSPYRQHHEFDKWVFDNYARFDALLREGERVVGEWLWQASGIKYKIHGTPFFAFDIFQPDGSRVESLKRHFRCVKSGINVVPAIAQNPNHRQPINHYDKLSLLTAMIDVFPEDLHEGLVYRVERKGKFDFMAKWVRPDFESGKYLPGLDENSPKDITLNRFV